MWLARLFFTLIALSIWTTVHAKERVALVIGNADYASSALVNSVNDAEDIASTLEDLNFSVNLVKNATRNKMQAAISEFVSSLNDDTVGLFYYSGHAVQYKGSNYLIPIGSIDKVNHVEDLPKNTVNTSTILDGLNKSKSNLNFVFLDACRDNPFKNLSKEITPGLAKASVGSRNVSTNLIMKDLSATRGVSETHEQVKDTKGILVAYSTMPGSVASDGKGRNSPYTESLLKHISKANSLAQIMLSDVQQNVQQETNGKQTPIFESAITGRFCFNETNNGCGKAVVNIHSSYLKGVKDIQKLTLPDGSSYEGQILNGKPHGKGVQIHDDGSRYEGEWMAGVSSGKGSMFYSDGGSYEGEWKDDLYNGLGVGIFKDGSRYEGGHKDGLSSGFGIQTRVNGERYEGLWKNGNPHGLGKYKDANGDYITGKWMDGEKPRNGQVIEFIDGNTYDGRIENGKASGKGVKKWSNGNHYDGYWSDDLMNGFGVYTWRSGDRYEGQWLDGKQINGIYTWTDGRRYEGEWDGDIINGNGVHYFSDGSTHTGGWKNDKKHGFGVTKESDGTLVEANYINGYPDGKIKITMTNDWIIEFNLTLTDELKKLYDKEDIETNVQLLVNLIDGEVSAITPEFIAKGHLKNGKRSGKSDVRWKDGSSYKGDMLNDMAHGEGVRVESDGGRYKGNWVKNKRDGYGIQDYANGDRYLGNWKDDEFHGRGMAYFANGSRYEGMFNSHKKDGYGELFYKDNDPSIAGKYIGEFKNNVRHGFGVMTWENGDRYEGEWENDKYHGYGLATTLDGYRYEGEWSHGKEVGKQ